MTVTHPIEIHTLAPGDSGCLAGNAARNCQRLAALGFLAAMCVFSAAVAARESSAARIRAAETGLHPAIRVQGEPEVRWTIEQRMAHWRVPGLSVAVIRDGKLSWAKAYGVRRAGTNEKVDVKTLFSVGSLSKVGTAAVTLRLVDAGALELDRDVNEYLTRWKVPANPFAAIRPVTLRGLLSHSAGLTVHGFPDFQPGETLPTIIDTLDGRSPAKTEPVRVFYTPGTRWNYSGGGTTVEQLVLESVTGVDFEAVARRNLFEPLGMTRSTYRNPLPAERGNIANAHDAEGRSTALPRGWQAMPEQAASGLWTTPSEYARLLIALMESYRGGESTFLSQDLARQMLTEVGASPFGLGPQLDGAGIARRFSHGGSNDSYKAWFEAYPHTGGGAVVMTNGANGTSLLVEVVRALAAAEDWPQSGAQEVPRTELSRKELDQLTGVYASSSPVTLVAQRFGEPPAAWRVRRDGAALFLGEADSNEGSRLMPLDRSHFLTELDLEVVRIDFVFGYDGSVQGFLLRRHDYAVSASKVSPGAT